MSKYIRTNLALLRAVRGKLTQREVSQATGIGQKTLSALETGVSKGIEYNTLVRLCEFFHCGIAEILIMEEEVDDAPPSRESLKRADELIALAMKSAVAAPPQAPAEIWAEFDRARERMQTSGQNSGNASKKERQRA